MGVCDGAGRAGTEIGLLITQRSRVQIPPPLLISAGQGPFPIRGRVFCVPGAVVKGVVGAGSARPGSETRRQDGTG
jgi:hypothetical protein